MNEEKRSAGGKGIDVSMKTNSQWKNWMGNQVASPEAIFEPKSLEEIQDIVKKAIAQRKRIRVAGAGTGMSPMVPTPYYLVEMSNLNKCLEVKLNDTGGYITVEAGMTVEQLTAAAAANGLSLPTTAIFPSLQVGGSISQGAHGTGWKAGTLSDAVSAVAMVLANGSSQTFSVDQTEPDLFNAVRLGLGSLEIIYSVTFKCLKYFKLDKVSQTINNMIDFMRDPQKIKDLVLEHEFLEIFWVPFDPSMSLLYYPKSNGNWEEGSHCPEPRDLEQMAFQHLFGPDARVGLTGQELPGSKSSDSEVKIWDIAYAIPIDRQFKNISGAWLGVLDIIKKYKEMCRYHPQQAKLHARFLGRSEALLSPALDNDHTFFVEFNVFTENDDWLSYFEAIENVWISLRGRPHWGKIFSWGKNFPSPVYPTSHIPYIRASYGGNWNRFKQIRYHLDPNRLFANRFIEFLFQL